LRFLKILFFYVFIAAISTPIKLIMYALDKEKIIINDDFTVADY
jgi:hypothetical protein